MTSPLAGQRLPTSTPPMRGFAAALRRDPLSALQQLAARGDVAEARVGPRRLFLLSHPDDVRDLLVTHQRRFHKGVAHERMKLLLGTGLLTSEDDFHLRQRRLAQPAFHHARIAAYAEIMREEAAAGVEAWQPGAAVDVHGTTYRLALRIAGRTLFGSAVDDADGAISRALGTCLDVFQRLALLPFAEQLVWLPIPAAIRFRRARRQLDDLVRGLIAERRASGRDEGDLLSMLLLARDAETGGAMMTDAQVRDEAMTILLAGHETTANALAWSLWLLATHPEAQARLHAEVDALGGAAPTVERLPWTRAVFAETLRLYPPAYAMGRRALVPHEAGGVAVPKGTIALVSPWITHRDPRWWPDATSFVPGRWLDPAAAAARPKFAFFPFGGGTRICIGEQFAWMEGVVVLATIAARWRVQPLPGRTPVPSASITLRPTDLHLLVERR